MCHASFLSHTRTSSCSDPRECGVNEWIKLVLPAGNHRQYGIHGRLEHEMRSYTPINKMLCCSRIVGWLSWLGTRRPLTHSLTHPPSHPPTHSLTHSLGVTQTPPHRQSVSQPVTVSPLWFPASPTTHTHSLSLSLTHSSETRQLASTL